MDMPDVAHLDPRTNSVSLAAVGAGPLETWIIYPGIAPGDLVRINWRGRGAAGEVSDEFGDSEVDVLDGAGRWMFRIPNSVLAPLSGGIVFYSFRRLDQGGQPVGDESLRRYFFIDRPDLPMWRPEVVQLRDAHDLVIDVELLDPTGMLVVTPPYAAMAPGQRVTLFWRPWYDESLEGNEVRLEHVVSATEVGQPLLWRLDYGDVVPYFDGFAYLQYCIEFDNGELTYSPEQRFSIVWAEPPAAPQLGAPHIPGHVGELLDPDDQAYEGGVWLIAENYPELELGDSLLLYAQGPTLELRTFRADASSVDSGRMAFFLDRAWLQSEVNRGQQVTFSYGVARQGMQRNSQALTVALQRPLRLPLPVIRDARPEADDQAHQGAIYPRDLQQGAQVNVPADAVTDGGALRLHWEGHGSTGNLVIDTPDTNYPRRFSVPRAAMAANFGRRLWVYYTVTKPGQAPQASAKFDLRVADFEAINYPVVQLDGVAGQQLSLAKVPATGCRCRLGSWPFMAEGQRLGMHVEGLPNSGKPAEFEIRPRDTEVTEEEYYDGEIVGFITKAFLQGLRLNQKFRVSVQASFDDGETWRNFRSVEITLIN
ncbi:hypothetical protein KSS93_10970 [Pseudomonas xanthosomatis]|uniref:hypothetical protein n=1 Tax=Pseudomonas xanthosomatis TaxID=2842356 RepID=UPI001C3D6FE0|nr:hypothetical protein [Pseudomonas xanthosomatis]QXH48397.1 hypothetical protein KSS93_10970 [Pseudomonas xanthosomatis]